MLHNKLRDSGQTPFAGVKVRIAALKLAGAPTFSPQTMNSR